MNSTAHYEALWAALPADARPEHLTVRRAFLTANVATGERVLDLGCGDGTFALALRGAGAVVVAADVAEGALARVASVAPEMERALVPLDGPLPFADAAFDVVWAGEVIEHVADTAPWLSEVRRVLAPRGRLLLSTPNHPPLLLAALALSQAAFARHFDPRSDHLRFYSRGTLGDLLEDFGFEQVEVATAVGLPGARKLLMARAVRSRF